jgi:hypothetical protein
MKRARSILVAAGLTATALAAASTGGCSAKKNTEIMVGVQTDVRIPKDIDEVEVRVFVDGVVVFNPRAPVGNGQVSLPGSFGIVAGSDASKQIVVEVVGYVSTQQRVLRRARMTFVQGRTVFLRMPLKFACYGQGDCPDQNDTCIAGECKSALIDATRLPDYVSSTQALGNGPGGEADACFEAETCLSTTTQVMAAGADGCSFLAPGGAGAGTPFTPVLVLPASAKTPGFCDATSCKVPVDHDVDEGWEWTDAAHSSFSIAAGLCTKLKSLGGRLEATTGTQCGEKTLDRPLCTPTGTGSGADGGTVGPPDTSTGEGGTKSPCLACAQTQCGAELSACSVDPICAQFIQCVQTCSPGNASCASACYATNTDPQSTAFEACATKFCGSACGATATDAGASPDGGGCVPKSCAQLGAMCGATSDGCGGLIDCGSCPTPKTCGGGGTPGQCG